MVLDVSCQNIRGDVSNSSSLLDVVSRRIDRTHYGRRNGTTQKSEGYQRRLEEQDIECWRMNDSNQCIKSYKRSMQLLNDLLGTYNMLKAVTAIRACHHLGPVIKFCLKDT